MSNKDFDGFEAHGSSDESRDASPQAGDTTGLPADFSEDEALFAQELQALFCVDGTEQGELLPYFAETLLEAHDPRRMAADEALVQRTRVRVLRQLNLPRRIVSTTRPGMLPPKPLPPGRGLAALLSTCLLFMCVTMALTLPFFRSGLDIVLGGPASSVQQASAPPQQPATTTHRQQTDPLANAQQFQQVSLSEAQSKLQFPMYWAKNMPSLYQINGIYLYQGTEQQWAAGPIADLEYSMNQPGIIPEGSGKISICEFKPQDNVPQVLQLGQTQLQIDNKAQISILLIDQWVPLNDHNPAIYTGRGELVYEQSGVLIWINGDERDGITGDTLLAIAHSFDILDPQTVAHMMMRMGPFPQGTDTSSDFFSGRVTYITNPDGTFTGIIGPDPTMNKDLANFS